MRKIFSYGLDAPLVVRNLSLGALACWILFALSFTKIFSVTVNGLIWPALTLSLSACTMVWHSAYGKVQRREILLDQLAWCGDECVLDVGCGRGLLAVAAARRVPSGHVIGIDIWQEVDLSGNSAEALVANAMLEGVADRLESKTADMQSLPLLTGSQDIVVSSTAIHNLYDSESRDRAIEEIARVLRPGGQLLIDDIRHVSEYADRLKRLGFTPTVTRSFSNQIWRVISFGTLDPATLIANKR